jgi:hypothetical protein
MSETRATLAQQGLTVIRETLAMRQQAGRFWVDDIVADMLFPLPGVDFELTSQVLGANPGKSRVVFNDGSAITVEWHPVAPLVWTTGLRAIRAWQDGL